MSDFIHPAYGCKLTSPFGPRTHPVTGKPHTAHKGVDFAKVGNIPILAAAPGTVREAREISTYGYAIVIQHDIKGKRMDTVYAHMKKGLEVQKGDKVRQGQRIGFMGNSGMSTGQHLHFELHNGAWTTGQPNAIDPWPYINDSMKLSDNGLNFIKKHEGHKLYWYELQDGGLTCGYGHYVTHDNAKKLGIKKGTTITQAQADAYLKADMQKFVDGTNAQLQQYNLAVNQNQFDALVSYAFNRGLGKADGTNGLRQLLKNSKNIVEMAKNIVVYWGTNVTYKTGLINRRKAEQTLFNTPVKTNTNTTTIIKEDDELIFSSTALKTAVENLIKDKAKQKETVSKAAKAGIINATWIDKYNKGEQKEHDILGVCVLYTLSK